jgi:energy-converting hydrogenase Eha subunit F
MKRKHNLLLYQNLYKVLKTEVELNSLKNMKIVNIIYAYILSVIIVVGQLCVKPLWRSLLQRPCICCPCPFNNIPPVGPPFPNPPIPFGRKS